MLWSILTLKLRKLVAPILNIFETQSETAIIQPKLLDFKENHFEYAGGAGGFIDKFSLSFCRGRIFNTVEEDKINTMMKSKSFGQRSLFFIRKEAYRKIKGFDDDFFRIKKKLICVGELLIWVTKKNILQNQLYHVGGATLNRRKSKEKRF